jgi:hypothetical protein
VFETPLLSITLFVGDQNIFAAFELYLPAEAADIFFCCNASICRFVLLSAFVIDLVGFRMPVFLDPFLCQLYAVLRLLQQQP